MKKLLEFAANCCTTMIDPESRQSLFNALSAREAGFEDYDAMKAHVQGSLSTTVIDPDNITVNIDLNDEVVVFRFNNVYDSMSDERFDVAFHVDKSLVVSQ